MKKAELKHLIENLTEHSKEAQVRLTIDNNIASKIQRKLEQVLPEEYEAKWETLDKQEIIQMFVDEIFEDIIDSDFFNRSRLEDFLEEALKDEI